VYAGQLLKKALKRKLKLKERSAKKWEERVAAVEAGKKERQEKREENLRKRKAGNDGGSAATKESYQKDATTGSGPGKAGQAGGSQAPAQKVRLVEEQHALSSFGNA